LIALVNIKQLPKLLRHMRGIVAVLGIVWLLWMPAPNALAQTEAAVSADRSPGTESIPLTMHEAVRLALKQNPQVIAARLEALESKQQVNVARSGLLPKAGLRVEDQMNRLNLATLIGGNTYPYSVGPYSNVQLGSSFDVPLIAVTAWRGYQAEKHRAVAAGSDDEDTRERIVAVVVAHYLSLQRSKANERAVQSRIDLAESLLKLAADALQQGTGTSTDALRANVELKVEQQNLVESRAQTSAYGYGLAEVLGLATNQKVVATEDLSSEADQQPDEQSSLKEALQVRPAQRLYLRSFIGRRAATTDIHYSTSTSSKTGTWSLPC
jgi:outer membrane protein